MPNYCPWGVELPLHTPLDVMLGLESGQATLKGPGQILKGKTYSYEVVGFEHQGQWRIKQASTAAKPEVFTEKTRPAESLQFNHEGRFILSFWHEGEEVASKEVTVFNFVELAVVRANGNPWDWSIGVGETVELKVRNKEGEVFGQSLSPPLLIAVKGELVVSKDGTETKGDSVAIAGGEVFKLRLESKEGGTLTLMPSPELDAGGFKFPDEKVVKPAIPTGRVPELDKSSLRLRVGQSDTVKAQLLVGEVDIAEHYWTTNDGALLRIEPPTGPTVTITALQPGQAKVFLTSKLGESKAVKEVKVDILPPAGSLQIAPSATQLAPRQTTRVEVRVLDEAGAPINLTGRDSGKIVVSQSNPDVLRIQAETPIDGKLPFTVEALREGVSDVTFTLTMDSEPSRPLSAAERFRVANVSEFMPIEVSLKQLDEATIRNTFGSAIARDYFVLEVNLVNNLRALSNGIKVDSILVYGQSFDVGIDMVKLVTQPRRGRSSWEPVTFGDVTREFSRAHSNKENPYPVELSSHPMGSVLINREATTSSQPLTAIKGRSLTLTKGDQMSMRMAQLPDMKISCVSADTEIVAVADGSILRALSVGETTVTATITYKDGDDEKCAAAVFSVRVLDNRAAFLTCWQTEGPLEPQLLSTGISYILSAPRSGKLGEYDFRTSRPVDFDRTTGALRAVAPGDILVTAISKTDQTTHYQSLRFVEPTAGLVLPPSVFEGPDGPIQIKAALRYKPVSQELVLLSQDRREATSPNGTTRSLIDFGFRILGWTFSQQAIGNMKPSLFQDDIWPGILALGPEIASRFLPDNASAHRNAILTQGMKEVEAIPFGGQIRKVVFFPKSILAGYLGDTKVRIAGIDSTSFRIAVGAVTSLDQLDQRNIPPTSGGGSKGPGDTP